MKTAIVTGASKGIGRAISIKLAKQNYNVIIFGRDKQKLKTLKHYLIKIGSKTEYYSGNVSNHEFVNKSINEIIKNYKRIDVLINNAGVAYFKLFVDSSLEDFRKQIDTNVIGVYNFSKACITEMIEKRAGTIVNIVSQAGKTGFNYGTTYAATKHAVMGLSRSLMLEVRKYNIRVIAICPGSVNTEMISESPIHENIKQVLQPEDIAEIVHSAIKLPGRALINEIEIRPTNP